MQTTATTSNQSDAKSRAIAAFNKGAQQATPQPQQTPVTNPNNISPEEMTAVRPATQQVEEPQQDVPQAPEQTPAEEQANRRFILLAKQEKALRAREAAIKQRETELAATQAQPQQPSFDESKYISKDRFRQDPLAVMSETGLSYEELTNILINQPARDPRVDAEFNTLKAQIEELKQQNIATKQQAEEQQTQAYQTALKQIKTDVAALVKNDDAYEAIRTAGATQDVVDLIEQTYQKDGVLLSNEEAAQLVEEYLIEQGLKWTKLSKIQKRLGQSNASTTQAPSAKTSESTSQQQTPTMKTLTNNNSSSRKLSSRERAVLAFNGELKK